jgi:hypothetical protein
LKQGNITIIFKVLKIRQAGNIPLGGDDYKSISEIYSHS